ncbi:MAG: hypothetical protein HRU17_00300 [Polyangiaceae bacterium]|nr:hypothetical protein [Polyangiaceae bacterium]
MGTKPLCSFERVWESSPCVDGVCDQDRCTDGLEAWWRFDETAGATFLDSSGNNDSCTGVDANRSDHASGRALDLNGTSSYLHCGELLGALDYPITLSAWVNWRQGSEDHSYTIVGTDEPSSLMSGARLYLYGGVGEFALIGVQLGNGLGYEDANRRTFTQEDGVYPVQAGVWTHIAGVVHSDSVAEL